MKRNIFFLLLLITTAAFAQPKLKSGPMVGYSEMREVGLWVQTTDAADVFIEYWEQTIPAKKFRTDKFTTTKHRHFTAKLIADNVEPGRKYDYALYINNKKVNISYPLTFQTQKLWQWREDPPPVTFAVASCMYINEEVYDRPGKPYGSDYEILEALYKTKPEFMLWMGDNIYLREVDWNSRTGIYKRYSHMRALPQLQPLMGSVHHYATWDDHDFGPNNADNSYTHKEKTLAAFQDFWVNPTFGINGKPGVTTRFEWADLEFFLLDNRYYRSQNERVTGKRQMFGDEQIEWLIDALKNSFAPFKIVVAGGQILNPVAKWETFSIFPEERQKLLSLIEKEKIQGVIFFSGDIHSSEITRLEREGTYPLYEFTVSSLTAGVSKPKPENNTARFGIENLAEHNFGHFTVTGPRKDRVLEMKLILKDGTAARTFTLKASELK